MDYFNVHGWKMARISEMYLSVLSGLMTPYGVDRNFVPLLYISENSGRITQKDLSEVFSRDKVSVMRIVDYLSEKGLVIRTQNELDRRCQFLEVTEKALSLVSKVKDTIKQTNDFLFNDFSEEERVTFEKGVNKLMQRISTLPESDYIIQAIKREKTN